MIPLLICLPFLLSRLLAFQSFEVDAAKPPVGEPTNAKEAAAQSAADAKAREAAEVAKRYEALVAMLSPEEQAWERLLQQSLGDFYLPAHQSDRLAGRSNAWDFVKDDPKLPRVLPIGDSVSRGYIQAVRVALIGK